MAGGDSRFFAFSGKSLPTRVCDLGAAGWSQAYTGIAALAWSQPLLPLPNGASSRNLAVFFLKTDSGDLLSAVVMATKDGFGCQVAKDSALQVVEYKRTLGFDRTEDSKPYFIY